MAINELNKDLDIIQKLDDEPNDVGGMTSAELKAEFDKGGNLIKDYINNTVVPAVNKNTADIAENEARREAEIAEILVEDALRDQHLTEHDTHFNKTDIEVALLKQDAHTHDNKDVLDGIEAVTQTLGNSTTKVPSEKAVSDALVQSGGMPGGGATGQVLAKKSDAGFDTEWKSVTDIGAAPAVHGHAVDDVSGVLPAEKGGTGKTTLKNSANSFINALDAGTSAPKDDDYFISQYVGGGTTNIDYYRRKISTLWTYIKGKADAVYAALSHTHAAGDITSGTFADARIPSLNTSKLTAGTLGLARGGTGQTTAPKALYSLTNGSSELYASGLATDDFIPVADVSATTGKKVEVAQLATFILGNQRPNGTYTGTGTKSFSITIGGTGKFLLLKNAPTSFSSTVFAIVTAEGTIKINKEMDFTTALTFVNGVLAASVSSSSSNAASYYMNGSGTTYTYQVL